MGLDSVEILMEVEDTFGIRIPDEEAEQIITVGDFHNSVWRHLQGRNLDGCHSQKLFYSLRAALSKTYGLQKEELRPNVSPNKLFPLLKRRINYKEFERNNAITLPDLELTSPSADILTWSGVGVIVGSLLLEIVLINFFDYSFWILLWTLASIVLVIAISMLLNPFRTNINAPTFKEFTRQTLAINYKTLSANVGTNRQEMESIINRIIADKVGLELEEITAEKRIAYDLGVD